MGRKNRRRKEYYKTGLGFNPKKYITPDCSGIKPKRNEIWFASLPLRYNTNVLGGFRPVLVISNDIGNDRSNIVTVIPMTSKCKHEEMPTHVWTKDGCLPGLRPSMFMAEQVTTISKSDLRFCVGQITNEEQLAMIEQALRNQLVLREQPVDASTYPQFTNEPQFTDDYSESEKENT